LTGIFFVSGITAKSLTIFLSSCFRTVESIVAYFFCAK
jgi:hypothetical protein